MTTTTVLGGLLGTVAVLPLSGFTDSAPSTTPVGGIINLTAALSGFAQPAPADSTISALHASFTVGTEVALVGSTVQLEAQVWTVPPGGTAATPRPGATCSLSELTGILIVGTVVSCAETGLAIPILAGERAFVTLGATVIGGLDTAVAINGGGSVGIEVG